MNLVYLSPVSWASFAQRSHKFVTWFVEHSQNGRVLWIDPYPTRLPALKDLKRPSDVPKSSAATLISNRIQVITPRALPIEPLPFSGFINRALWKNIESEVARLLNSGPTMLGIGKPSELAIQLLKKYNFTDSFYDAMDDFPAFYPGLSRRSMARRQDTVVAMAKKMFASSTELAAIWSKHHPKLILNACDVGTLPDFNPRSQQESAMVYIGTFGEWFDWDMVFNIAASRPKVRLVLIGPVYKGPGRDLPENVELRPPLSHTEAMVTLKDFKTGLIPFKINRITASVDPVKYYEYRGMGLSVISTGFGEMASRRHEPGVFLLDPVADSDKIGVCMDDALNYQSTPSEVADFRMLNSWDERFGATHLLR